MTDLSSESKTEAAMRSRRRRLKLGVAAALATMVLVAPTALARPAGAGAGAGLAHLGDGPSGVSTASATPPSTGDVVLHRDGSKAVPFRAYPVASGSSQRVDLRRDGSKAYPFVRRPSPDRGPDSRRLRLGRRGGGPRRRHDRGCAGACRDRCLWRAPRANRLACGKPSLKKHQGPSVEGPWLVATALDEKRRFAWKQRRHRVRSGLAL